MEKMGIEKESLLQKYITIFFVVSGYWIVSILTVFINKMLLSEINLNAPMFIALYQTLVTAIICLIKKGLAKLWPHHFSFPETNTWDFNTMKTILPVSLMFTTMIATNNLCLKYVSVAFYYIGRSLTTIFNVSLTYLILGETTSKKSLLFCGVIIFGFYLGVDQENLAGSLSISGTIFGVLGSLSLSLFSIFTKKVLPKVNNEVWALSYYNNVYATILFIPLMIFNNEFVVLVNYMEFFTPHFWTIMTIGGICGFAIGFFTSLQIKYTSALTHNISGTAKACAQTILATYWYQETKSVLWWCSNFIVLFGSAGYARVKQLDMEKKHKENGSHLCKLATPIVNTNTWRNFSLGPTLFIPRVQEPAPNFKGTAVINESFKDIQLSDFKGKYVVLFFYPLDFTFVCPTELIAFNEHYDDFKKLNTEVIGCSIDSHFSHLGWMNTKRSEGGLGKLKYPLLSDINKNIARDYNVLLEKEGVALRGLFIIDPNGILKQITINDLPIGRSVDETLRLIEALQFVEKHGEVCPANWQKGGKTIKPDPQGSKEYFQATSK